MVVYSFVLDSRCPFCEYVLDEKVGSVKVNGEDGVVDEHGYLSEDSGAQYILSNPEPDVRCGNCGKELVVLPEREYQ